jgi:hypothetical protein
MKKILIIISILLLCSCKYVNGVNESFVINYLKSNYGEDKIFVFSSESTCDLYQLGYCSAYYKASDIEDEIYVIWYDGNGNDIRDDYLFKKYKSEIKDYYYNLFSKEIKSKFNVEILSSKSDYKYGKDSKFDDILNYENLNLSLKVNIASDDNETTKLGETLKNVINNRKVKNVSSLYLTSYQKNCNLNDVSNCKKINSSYIEVKITEDKQEELKK